MTNCTWSWTSWNALCCGLIAFGKLNDKICISCEFEIICQRLKLGWEKMPSFHFGVQQKHWKKIILKTIIKSVSVLLVLLLFHKVSTTNLFRNKRTTNMILLSFKLFSVSAPNTKNRHQYKTNDFNLLAWECFSRIY